jgi:PAS domain S-box-containing protein
METDIKVLLIEDNPGDVRLIQEMLSEVAGLHLSLETAPSLADGIRRLSGGGVSVVLLDLGLPDSFGPDTFANLHLQAPEMPIIVLTGLNDEAIGLSAIQQGAQDYLVKGHVDSNLLIRSITYAIERKRMEGELKHREEHFRALIENSSDAVMMVDEKGNIKYASPSVSRVNGYEIGEMMGQWFLTPVHPDDLELAMAKFQALQEEGSRVETMQMRVRHKEGHWLTVEAVGKNLLANPAVNGIVINFRDITQRKQAEASLQESQEMLRSFIDSATDGFTLWDKDMNLVEISRVAMERYGLRNKAEIIGKNFVDVMPVIPETGRNKAYREVMQTGRPLFIEDAVVPTPGGDRHLTLRAFKVGDGLGIIGTDITERKKAEAALRESEDKYRTLIENINDIVFTLDDEGRFLYVSPRFEKTLGYPPKEVLGRPFASFVAAEYTESVINRFQRGIIDNRTSLYEIALRFKNGGALPVELNITPLRDNRGHFIGRMVVARDVTERQAAQQALKASEERYRSLIDNIRLGIALVDANFNIQMVNPALHVMFGEASEAPFLGKKCFQRFEGRNSVCLHCPGRVVMATGREASVESEGVRRDGSRFPMVIRAFPVVDGEGKVTGFIEVMDDVSERKKTAEALREKEQRFRAIFNAADRVAFVISDLSGEEPVITEFSPGAEHILGYSSEEIKGKPTFVLHAAEDRAWFDNLVQGLRQKESGITGETTMVRKSGEKFPVFFNAYPMYDALGKLASGLCVSLDITEQKQAEEKVRQFEVFKRVDSMRSQLLANVSHELRTPLAAIKGFVSTLLLTDVKWSDKDQREFLEIIDKEADRLTHLISDILDMSRLEGKAMRLELDDYTPAQIMASVETNLANLTRRHRLIKEVPEDLPLVQVDQMRIGQVLTNLVENAAKYCPEGTVITVAARKEGERLVMAVLDEGPGIPTPLLGRVFDRFYQTESVVTGRKSGTGLGLAICRGIIEAHGGRIWVESQMGKGSRFYFNLPVTKKEGEHKEGEHGENPGN